MSATDNACPSCDQSFDTDHGMKVHHKLTHGESLALIECECENCGETFEEYSSRIDIGRGRFCTSECQDEHGRVETECATCGSQMSVERHRYEKYRMLFCSDDCKGGYQLSGEDHPQYTKISVECDRCSETFKRTPSSEQLFESSYCSIECSPISQTGERHPGWKEETCEYRYYGPNWSSVREDVIQRDEGQCQICGVGRDEYVAHAGFDLDVHHIVPLKHFDTIEKANQMSNLKTLCRSCHRQEERGIDE